MELKLLAGAKEIRLVERHPAFRAVRPKTRKTISTYYDTEDLALFSLGACLRVRQTGKTFVQTMKLDRAGDAIGTRGEWEWNVPSAALDLSKFAGLPGEARAIVDLGERLAPRFVTRIERVSRLLTLDSGTAIEAVIDRGAVEADGKSIAVSEVELELKHGSTRDVFRLAISLSEDADLRFGSQSKSERGYRLGSALLPARPSSALPRWHRDVSIGVAFPRIVQAILKDIASEIHAVHSAGDVGGVHRMRAAIRRLRSSLVLFAPYLDRRSARLFNEALRTLGRVLGQGRDWDVFITETMARLAVAEDAASLSLLRPLAERRRTAAHTLIAETVQGRSLTSLILSMGAWTADSAWLRKIDAETPLVGLVPELLDDVEQTVRKRARKLDIHASERLHDLRKALKRLRFSIEDTGSLFPPKPVDAYLQAVKKVLGTLGDLNDGEVTGLRIGELVSSGGPEIQTAGTALLQTGAQRLTNAGLKLPKLLAKLHAIEPFWR